MRLHPAAWVALSFVLLACTAVPSSTQGPDPGAPTVSASNTPAAPAALVDQLQSQPFGTRTVSTAIGILARAGVATYEHPHSAEPAMPVSEPTAPVKLLVDQVRAMALEAHAGGGIEGAELDALVETEPDLAAPSYIPAGYVAAVDTEGAAAARTLMGDHDWRQAPSIVFPQLVMVLFTADIARERMSEDSAGRPADLVRTSTAAQPPLALAMVHPMPVARGDGLCSQVSNFVSGALKTIFDALRLGEASNGAGRVLTSIWNFVVSTLETIVTTIVRKFEQSVLDAIGRAAAIVGTVATAISAVRPWAVSVKPQPSVTEKGISGIRPPELGRLVARVELGRLDDWPAWAKDCAETAGRPLPNLKPEGAPVAWQTLVQNPAGLVQEGLRREVLDAEGAAQLDFTTLTDEVDEPYQTFPGAIFSRVTIERQSLRTLADMVEKELWSELPSIVVGPLQTFLGPSMDKLKSSLGRLLSVHASGPAVVLFHVHQPTPPPPTPPLPPPSAETQSDFCTRYRALLTWWWEGNTLKPGSQAWASEIVRQFTDMRPLGPANVVGAVDVHIGLYTVVATISGPRLALEAAPWAEQMPDAVATLDAHCAIQPGEFPGR